MPAGCLQGDHHTAATESASQLEWHAQPNEVQRTGTILRQTGTDDEDLSDLDDDEMGMYLHTEEEAKLKEVIWTELNRDFLDKQQVKAAAAEEHARKVHIS